MRPPKPVDETPAATDDLPAQDVDSGEHGSDSAVAADLGDPRQIMAHIRANNREALTVAREAVRETARQARETFRETARQTREVEREMARQLRETRGGHRHDRVREPGEPDTRARIQQVALELFTANGYEATSLREIAERLGVTKAALYYHFKTKDDIIDSLVADRVAKLDELISWADAQPRGVATRREAVYRYSQVLCEQGHHGLMRFFERNQSSMTQHKAGVMMRDRMIRFLDALADRDASLTDQIRCSLALFALHSTWFTIRDPQATDDQRREAALEVALDLVDKQGPTP